ncbi:hypothetical protein [Rhodopirellula sp. P2]|uniref:hypothetical protein n=1 Tax=Rhodopirellula sp. P2 TaxID=2127060 RepID=UPI002367F5A7|nr:hypothetical protein [Rhodopirellula sp. P2]WDQ19054.1 hypothetical protein PSR62_11065 [Rhodopirellula sp. P2]
MHRRRLQIAAIVFALWAFSTCACFVTGTAVPGLLNRVHEIEYGCSDATIVDGVWIRPCMTSTLHGFSLPLVFSSRSTGPPFSIGVTVLDYANNAIECRNIVLDELVVTIDGTSTKILSTDTAISAPFEPYYSGTANTKADALAELGGLIDSTNVLPIHVDGRIRIQTTDHVIEQSFSGVLEPGGWQGTWFILEALFPHA